MKARIYNGEYAGEFHEQWLIDNNDIVFAGELVKDWELITTLPSEDERKYYKLMWDGNSWYEGITFEQMYNQKIIEAIEIDLEYTKRISDLMMKHNDKFIEGLITGVPYTIPQSALDMRDLLKEECNTKIAALGITDYTYRQSVPKLAKNIT